MLLHLPQILDPGEVAALRARLQKAAWADGRITAGYQSAIAKNNLQLPEQDVTAAELSAEVRAALKRSSLFFAAALPRRIFTPLFNCYRGGDGFGSHIDNAVRYERSVGPEAQEAPAVRTDLSATLFLSSPEEYEGGELVIEDLVGTQRVKLPAGDMIMYPATSVHRVDAITRGARFASFFWIQSLVRDAGKRKELFELDVAIQQLNRDHPEHPAMVALVGAYHNLLRRWADV
jgi:PKHD-type hydroxylase